jgi:hypothetical protein
MWKVVMCAASGRGGQGRAAVGSLRRREGKQNVLDVAVESPWEDRRPPGRREYGWTRGWKGRRSMSLIVCIQTSRDLTMSL